MRTAILWFRRDLRLHDHPALAAALDAADRVVPIFVFDDALLRGRWPCPNRTAFMLASLEAHGESLRARGSGLVIRSGTPEAVISKLAQEVGASDVFVSRDYSPYARRRDATVANTLKSQGVAFHARAGVLVHEPESIATGDSRPYSVFSPFRRRWESLQRRPVLGAPLALSSPAGIQSEALPTLHGLRSDPATATEMVEAGESAARQRMEAWANGSDIDAYADQRDRLNATGTSRASQDLRWGLISANELVDCAAGEGKGRTSFVSEVCWREFYYHVLWHHPRLTRESFQKQFRTLDWNDDREQLAAWQEGRTGYPVIDAAMRQLITTGWMHNRARMMVASFLTKDLLIDWRHGERFFMHHLVDGDLASNNGGWQWAASTGTDPQPYFRIFNPVTQGKKFDPEGDFVRRWLPALGRVPTKYVHEPWKMSMDVQEASGCVIGRDYPAPIVDHAEARQRALRVYGEARARRV